MILTIPKNYHNFKGTKTLNIYSNIAFLLPILYLVKTTPIIDSKLSTKLLLIHLIMIFSLSSYYHVNPTNKTIIPDMFGVSSITLLTSYILLDLSIGYLPLVYLLSGASVYYFKETGNLIPYALILTIPPLFTIYRLWNQGYNRELIIIISLLGILRLVEYNDALVYKMTKNTLNGHSLKHIIGSIFFIEVINLMKKLHKI